MAASTAAFDGLPSGAASARSISSCSAATAAACAWLQPKPPFARDAQTSREGTPRGQCPSARSTLLRMVSMRSVVVSSIGVLRP